MTQSSPGYMDLPVFDGNEPILRARQIEDIAEGSAQPKAIRYCRARLFDSDDTISVGNAVAIAEREFCYIQESLGISVVKHIFGLYPIEAAVEHNPDFETLTRTLPEGWEIKGKSNVILPEGFILGAEVIIIDRAKSGRTIPQAVADTNEWFGISDALTMYKEAARGIRLADLDATQCTLGIERVEGPLIANRTPKWIMADIEPLLIQK